MNKTGYIVAFNSKNQKSKLYRKFKTFKTLIRILDSLWKSNEEFIVISLRIYKEGDEFGR